MVVFAKNGLISCLVLLACASFAQDEASAVPRRKPSEMPKVATSSDGFVKVFAADVPGDPMGFRLPILQFTTRNLREIERAYNLEIPRRDEPGLVIHALDGRTNDTREIARSMRRNGTLTTHVWLPSPGFSDLDSLRFEISRAYLTAWIHRAAPKGTTPGELPDWVVQGALRAADRDTAHDDIRFVLNLWSSARLPFFPALCSDLRMAKGKAAALPGYVVGYIREKHLFKKILERLASGGSWDGAWLAEQLTGEKDPAEQDRVSDERLFSLARAVLSPGRASEWDVWTFASRLRLYPTPPVSGKGHGGKFDSITFSDAIGMSATNESVRVAAAQKAREMPMYVIGRGDELVAAGEAYRKFLLAVARNEDAVELRSLLQEADSLLEKAMKAHLSESR